MSPALQSLAQKHSYTRKKSLVQRVIPQAITKAGAAPILLNFNMQQQVQTQWCWAATSTSVSVFYNSVSKWTQCLVAQNALGTQCCQSPGPCNEPWYLDRALKITGNFDSVTAGIMNFSSVQSELTGGKVIGARVGWNGGGGHFMVIHGCHSSSGINYLNIDDPIYGKSDIEEKVFATNYHGSGTWTHSYKTKQ